MTDQSPTDDRRPTDDRSSPSTSPIQAVQIRKAKAEADILETWARWESAWLILALTAAGVKIARDSLGIAQLLSLLL